MSGTPRSLEDGSEKGAMGEAKALHGSMVKARVIDRFNIDLSRIIIHQMAPSAGRVEGSCQ